MRWGPKRTPSRYALQAARIAALALAGLLGPAGCGSRGGDAAAPLERGSPNARRDVHRQLVNGRDHRHDPSDGGGRAWLEGGEKGGDLDARVGRAGRFTIVFEVGPLGIARGGKIALQIPPYWGWSTPQVVDPDQPGFTIVTTNARGAKLVPTMGGGEGLLEIGVEGRALASGERVRMDYGVGSARAAVDRFRERQSRFFIGVDGDGDGWRDWIAEPPMIDVAAGPPRRLVLTLPPTARPGETVPLRAALLDEEGSAAVAFEGEVHLDLPPGVEGPRTLPMPADAQGIARTDLRLGSRGIVRVRGEAPGGLVAESNPCVVAPDVPQLLFGDLHGHSNMSDGTGTPEDYYRFARDVAGLDVSALTDHDHWGMPFLDETPANWSRIEAAARTFYEPGRFVTVLGYEWTSWIWGHRHVLHFEDTATIRSSIDDRYGTPQRLWDALRGAPVLTFAHHSAGLPVATDWSIPPDPVLEPVTEIASVHGSSESFDTPWPISGMIEGNTVRDALGRGYRLGLVGSGDSHDGHPGLVQLADERSGGLAGIFANERTREAVLEALRARRVYATNGARIVLEATLDGAPMGSSLPRAKGRNLAVRVASPGPIEAVEVITRDGVIGSFPGKGERSVAFESTLEEPEAGSWVYLRVRQQDGGAAWSSPFFFE